MMIRLDDLYLSEAQEQELVIAWAQINKEQFPQLKRLFHIPNGGKRDKKEAAHFKRLGVQAGVSDLFLPFPNKGYHGLFIEMKSKKGKPTDKQLEFLSDMADYGYMTALCKGADEAIKIISNYII